MKNKGLVSVFLITSILVMGLYIHTPNLVESDPIQKTSQKSEDVSNALVISGQYGQLLRCGFATNAAHHSKSV